MQLTLAEAAQWIAAQKTAQQPLDQVAYKDFPVEGLCPATLSV